MSIPFIHTEIGKYRVIMRTSEDKRSQHVLVTLYSRSVRLIAQLLFTDAEPPKVVERHRHIYLIYPRDQYADAIDLLRNEKPVYLVTNPPTNSARIQTTHEDVGVGEDVDEE